MVNPPVRRGATGDPVIALARGTLLPVGVSPGGTRNHKCDYLIYDLFVRAGLFFALAS